MIKSPVLSLVAYSVFCTAVSQEANMYVYSVHILYFVD